MNRWTTRRPTAWLARLQVALSLAPALLPLLVPATTGADAVSDFEAMRENQQKNTDAALSTMPVVDARHIDDVMRLRLEAGNFVIRTPLPTTKAPGYARAKVAELTQPLMVRVGGGAAAAPAGPLGPPGPGTRPSNPPAAEAVVPAEFLLQLLDYSTPRQITNLSVAQTGPAVLSIVHGTTTPTRSRNVQLMVQRDANLPGGSAAQLVVNETDTAAGGPPVSLSFAARDCAALVREHRQAADQYLRPILAELALEGVFAPDPILAAQVFPGDVKVDEATAARVQQLLPDLGAQDYRRRDRATADLQALGAGGALVLLVRTDRSALTPEQNARIDQVLTPLGVVPPARAARLRRDPDFLLNCLYGDDPSTRRSAAAALRELTGEARIDPDAPAGVRGAAVREARKKLLAGKGAP